MNSLWRLVLVLLFTLGAGPTPPAQARAIVSYSQVMEDGSLKVSGQKIWLYGIFIPLNDRTCRTYQIPIKCGQWSLLALQHYRGIWGIIIGPKTKEYVPFCFLTCGWIMQPGGLYSGWGTAKKYRQRLKFC